MRCSKESPMARSTILASDHAPHAQFEKEVEFDRAPFGIVGLETELGLFLDLLVHGTKRSICPA